MAYTLTQARAVAVGTTARVVVGLSTSADSVWLRAVGIFQLLWNQVGLQFVTAYLAPQGVTPFTSAVTMDAKYGPTTAKALFSALAAGDVARLAGIAQWQTWANLTTTKAKVANWATSNTRMLSMGPEEAALYQQIRALFVSSAPANAVVTQLADVLNQFVVRYGTRPSEPAPIVAAQTAQVATVSSNVTSSLPGPSASAAEQVQAAQNAASTQINAAIDTRKLEDIAAGVGSDRAMTPPLTSYQGDVIPIYATRPAQTKIPTAVWAIGSAVVLVGVGYGLIRLSRRR